MRLPRNRLLRGLFFTLIYAMALLGILASGGGGGGGVTVDSIILDDPVSPTYESTVSVTGSLVVIRPSLTEVGDEYSDTVDVEWENQSTGQSGSSLHRFAGSCVPNPFLFLLPLCNVTADDGLLSISIDLNIGSNTIKVEAEGKEATVVIVRLAPQQLGRPTGVSVLAADGEAVISWNDVVNASSYNIYYASSSGVTKSSYTALPDGNRVSGASSPRTVTGLFNGVEYYFVVTADNASPAYSESVESIEVMAIVEGAPSPPSGVSIEAITNDGVDISWEPVRGATSYNLYYATSPGVTKSNYSSLPDGTRLSDVSSIQSIGGLTLGEDYYFVVTAENVYDEGNESSEIVARIGPNLTYDVKTFRFTWMDFPGASHYRILENPDGISGFSQVSGDIPPGTEIYDHEVALYRRTNASYIFQSCDGPSCTDVSQFDITDQLIDAIGMLIGSNTSADDEFGYSVSLSADGGTLAVGAHREGSGTSGINTTPDDLGYASGAVYVFSRNGGGWSQQAFIKSGNTDEYDNFGVSVSLSADGNTLAVGADIEESATIGVNSTPNNNSDQSGAAYVFTRVGDTWSQQAYIKSGNTDAYDHFGGSVSLSADGNTLAVGAHDEDGSAGGVNPVPNNLASDSGAAYLFSRSGNDWSQQAYLKKNTPVIGRGFGYSVALGADGDLLAVGSASTGTVHVYARSGSDWSYRADLNGDETVDGFGHSISVSADGGTIAVGADGEDSSTSGINTIPNNNLSNAGAAYVFVESGGSWMRQAYFKASNPGSSDYFGISVSLSADGDTLTVGAYQERSNTSGLNSGHNDAAAGAGAAYVFSRNLGIWSQLAFVKSGSARSQEYFGRSVGLSADGVTLLVGASGSSNLSVGAAYLY